nr:hypothetical protein [Micromonospora sp. DSM 115978]
MARFKIKSLLKFLAAGLLPSVGALGAVASLGGFSSRTNLLLLRLYGVGVLLMIVLWGVWQYFRTRSRERDNQLEVLTAVVAEIGARQAATHDEQLVLTITAGQTPTEDRVHEKARMTPKPLVVFKPVRPILPTGLDGPVSLKKIDFRVGVEEGDDGPVHVLVTPLSVEL